MASGIANHQASPNPGGLCPLRRKWAQVAQGTHKSPSLPTRSWFQSQPAVVKTSDISYPTNHLLGIPQEIRDAILEFLRPAEEVAGTRPETGYESYQLVCRQVFYEASRRWNYQPVVLVPSNRATVFVSRTLDITVLHSNAYHNVKSLFFEMHHNSPRNIFCQLAQVLRLSTQLEELHLFGIGPDGYGTKTSSTGHGCGKHDTSIVAPGRKLHIDGQHYDRRLTVINSIAWLENLRVLVLDNLNMPLLQAHVLKNKPRLEKLYIAADPRSMLHPHYKNCEGLQLGSLIFPVLQDLPPVKQLHVDSNAIFTASSITAKVARTLESLEWVIPDVNFQQYANKLSFLCEAATLLGRLHLDAKQLRELRVCVNGPLSEDHWQYANFMGTFKDCVSRMQCLQLVEVHIHSKSQWFATELIHALPPSVTRFYLSDLFVDRDILNLCESVGSKTGMPLGYAIDFGTDAIGEDVDRKDFIKFNRSKLAFVGYEFGLNAKEYDENMMMFLKLNGRLLDKERNRHLASLQGRYIPSNDRAGEEYREDVKAQSDELESAMTHEEAEETRKEWSECALGDEHEYFGDEDAAEVVFRLERFAGGGFYSCPAVVQVDDGFKFSSHWLSK